MSALNTISFRLSFMVKHLNDWFNLLYIVLLTCTALLIAHIFLHNTFNLAQARKVVWRLRFLTPMPRLLKGTIVYTPNTSAAKFIEDSERLYV